MAKVSLSPEAARGFGEAPTGMIRRINNALERLEKWPQGQRSQTASRKAERLLSPSLW
jgi:hypothetical protein